MTNQPVNAKEEKLAEIYMQTKGLLDESAGRPTRKMFEILGNTLLTQIQGTIYWMARALEAERQLRELNATRKAKLN